MDEVPRWRLFPVNLRLRKKGFSRREAKRAVNAVLEVMKEGLERARNDTKAEVSETGAQEIVWRDSAGCIVDPMNTES